MDLLNRIRLKASGKNSHIIFPEGDDERIIKAAEILIKDNISRITLLANQKQIAEKAKNLGVDLKKINIIDPAESDRIESYTLEYFKLREHKGISMKEAESIVAQPLFFGAMMVRNGEADGCVAGADNTTGNVVKAALHCIGLAEGVSILSSFFMMIIPGWDRVISFADGAIVPDPDPAELASIAITSAKNYKRLTGCEPIVSMLSFSTYGSAKHPMVDKVTEALKIVKKKDPSLEVDGELQLDASVIPEIGEKKASGSRVAGKANVLIFPDLNSGNIGYKLTQYFAKARAIGPVVQGLRKPMNDLSRGCTISDIVNVSAIASLLAD